MSWWKRIFKLFKRTSRNEDGLLKKVLAHIQFRKDEKAKRILTSDFVEAYDTSRAFLYFAALCGNEVIVQHLLNLGYEVDAADNDTNDTPLMLAVMSEQVETVKILLEANANIYMTNAKGESALQMAFAYLGNSEIVKLFLSKMKSESVTNRELVDKMMSVKSCAGVSHLMGVPTFRGMLQQGFDVNSIDSKARTSLHLAVMRNDTKMMRLLIDHGARVNTYDGSGMNPLIDAVFQANKDAMEILLNAGADPNAKHNHRDLSPVYLTFINVADATVEVTDECVQLLFQHGAIPENSSEYSATLFDLALCDEEFNKFNMLINYLALLEELGKPFDDSVLHCKQEKKRLEIPDLIAKSRTYLNRKIGDLSLLELLTVDENKMKIHVQNGNLMTELNEFVGDDEYKRNFPYYCSTLTKRVSKARRAVELRVAAISAINDIMGENYNLCYVPANKVVGYLNEEDLENLGDI